MTIDITNEFGQSLTVSMSPEGERETTVLVIDGVRYHFERIARDELMAEYRVDSDPGYHPRTDSDGFCYTLAPFSE